MKSIALWLMLSLGLAAHADIVVDADPTEDASFLDTFDPNAPEAEFILDLYDMIYEATTGESAWLPGTGPGEAMLWPAAGCYRSSCAVWAHVSKAEQRLYLYLNGRHVDTWLVSSGTGNRTPNFDRHPNGRIYTKYSSKAYPGGDYQGLGNMPYAVFIQGGFAIHGTPKSNWKKLGQKASHGCIRVHPDNGKYFNQLVRQHGIQNVWITVN